MKVTRRSLIKSGAVLGAVVAAPTGTAMAADAPRLIIYDSRLPAARAFAKANVAPRIDVAVEDAAFWRSLRAASHDGVISGLTRWSDWVIVRGFLEEKGKRVKSEVAERDLFRWTMS